MWSSKQSDQSKGPSKDDLHQWSIYRQNLNAALASSSSSTVNSAPGNDLTLKPETVSNILSSSSFRNDPSDADHFLKFGLPRVKNPIEEQQQQLAGRVKNQIKLFNEKTSAVTDERFANRKAIRRLSSNHKQNLSLNDDLNYNLGKEDQKQSTNVGRSGSKRNGKSASKSSSKNASKNASKNESNSSSGNCSPSHQSGAIKALSNDFDVHNELPKQPVNNRLSNFNHPTDRRSRTACPNQPSTNYNSLTKQWKSNPNLQDDPQAGAQRLREPNKHHSISAYDVSRSMADSDRANVQARLEQLRKCRQFENTRQANGGQSMNPHKSDDDSLTKSLDKNSPCDELDFRKGSLNDDDLSFEHAKLHKYAKSGLQSSDSEFVLSLDGGKSQSMKTKQPHLVCAKIYHEFDSTSNISLLCGGARQKIRVLDNVSFEAKPGDMLALIGTNPLESSTILDILMNQHSRSRTRTMTELYLNGQPISELKLSKLCAYVGPNANLCNKMSTRQTILFYNLLQSTNRETTFDSKKRIDALLNELNLDEVKHTCIGNLNESEKIRLQIAIALMLDTDLLLLDQPIRSMDIFDSYFIIDYIRQWTLMSGKIAIIALQPPSFEILSLFSKVSLISTGRTVYFGDRSKMAVYFSYSDYPCPAYKNPADYYLDLITVDHLSSSAMLESNHRIESLVQVYEKHKKQFKKRKPSSGALLPPKRTSFVIDFLSLWIRAMIFCFPYNVINLSKRLLLAVSLSLVCGCIFFKMRLDREQEGIWDRFGYYHSLLGIFAIPLFLHEIKSIHEEKKHVLEELRMKVYSKQAYFLSYLIYTFPGLSMIYLGFVLPASSMAIQKPDLLHYIVVTLCYLHVIRLLAIAVSWCFSTKIRSSIAFGLVYFALILISGNNLHEKNLNIVQRLVQNLSIYTYTYESLINWEFDNATRVGSQAGNHFNLMNQRFLCSSNPLVEHKNAIVARAECAIQSRQHIVEYLSLNHYFTNWTQPLAVYLGYSSVILLTWYCILCALTTNNSHLLQARSKLKETSSSFRKRCCKHEYL